MAWKAPSIPAVSTKSEDRRVLGPVKEIIEVREGRRGDWLQKNVTLADLIELGLITEPQAQSLKL